MLVGMRPGAVAPDAGLFCALKTRTAAQVVASLAGRGRLKGSMASQARAQHNAFAAPPLAGSAGMVLIDRSESTAWCAALAVS